LSVEPAPFYSAHSALRWAYGIAGLGVYERPVTSHKEEHQRDPRRTPRFPGLSPMEKHAQAAWIIRAAERCASLTPTERDLVSARFLVPNSPEAESAKQAAIRQVGLQVAGYYSYGREFVEDTVRRFAGEAHQTNAEWAAALGKSKRAVRDSRQTIMNRLRNTMTSALEKLEGAMEERGYVAA